MRQKTTLFAGSGRRASLLPLQSTDLQGQKICVPRVPRVPIVSLAAARLDGSGSLWDADPKERSRARRGTGAEMRLRTENRSGSRESGVGNRGFPDSRLPIPYSLFPIPCGPDLFGRDG